MRRILTSFILFFVLSTGAWAEQCPSLSDWILEDTCSLYFAYCGKSWHLKKEVADQWFQLMDFAEGFDLLPSTPLSVEFTTGSGDDDEDNDLDPRVGGVGRLFCRYDLDSVYKSMVISKQVNVKPLSDKFNDEGVCTTTAGEPERCAWDNLY